MLLVDILTALAIGTFFVAILFESSSTARSLFEKSLERSRLLDIYKVHASEFEGMFPYESRKVSVSSGDLETEIIATARWYGNDRIETDVVVGGLLAFSSVRAYPFENSKTESGTPVCSVDFGRLGNISIAPVMLPIDPLLPLTDIEVRNNIAYVSIDSSRAVDPDLLVVDIASSSGPVILSSINTGPGISSIASVGQRLFAAAVSTASQVHIVRFDSLYEPILEKKYTLPLPGTTTPPTVGSAISYHRNYIYLGTDKWQGAEFSILDVSTASDPVYKGGFEIGSKVMDIFMNDEMAYLATAARDQMSMVDVHDPLDPVLYRSFSPSGWSRQEGKRVMFFEDSLHLGRTSGGFDIKTDHELFSWASTSISTFDSPISRNVSGGIYGIVADKSAIYVASREAGHEFQVFERNLEGEPVASYSLPVAAQTLTCDNDKLYLLANSAPVIYEISFK